MRLASSYPRRRSYVAINSIVFRLGLISLQKTPEFNFADAFQANGI
jgi:hypothetical protein